MAQFVNPEQFHQAAPLVAGHIETGNLDGLQGVLNGLGVREWHHPAAVEQFAFALSFQHPLDPSKVRQAREALDRHDWAPNTFLECVADVVAEALQAISDKSRGRAADEVERPINRDAVMQEILERYPNLHDRKQLFRAMVDAILRVARRVRAAKRG